MITDSSKDYGTGNVLMILDGETPLKELRDYLTKHYGVKVFVADSIERTPEGANAKGFINQATAIYIHPVSTLGSVK